VIVVPGLNFDLDGNRIGYGAGYYDRTLVRYPSAVTIGVAFDFQMIAEVPVTSTDVPVSLVITERGLRADTRATKKS
jgi:5-formyltetrahydrofolate cyclo-ligase